MWETANRSTEFLFIGLSLVLGFVGIELYEPARFRWLGRAITASALAAIFVGGLISGWSPAFRLAKPYRVEAAGHVIQPEGTELALWVRTNLPSGSRFAASDADARLLIAKSDSYALTGGRPDIKDILKTSDLPRGKSGSCATMRCVTSLSTDGSAASTTWTATTSI